jgi:glycosyltransferase involved in cell wall biosynthesis
MPLHFSVIVPTRDRPQSLHRCLKSLARLAYDRAAFEVIVVDDGGSVTIQSTLDSFSRQLRVRLLQQKNSGPARARNVGAQAARGAWLAFLDDDCESDPDWLTAFGAATPNEDEILGGMTVNRLNDNQYSTVSQQLLDYLHGYFLNFASPFRFFPSNNLVVPAQRFRSLGGFDERFSLPAGEDREFCSRWLQSGGRLRHVSGAAVRHAHSLNLGTFLQQHFHYGRGAFVYDLIRKEQQSERLRVLPLSFYAGLLALPWKTQSGSKAPFDGLLLALSQVSNAAGYLYQLSHHAIASTSRKREVTNLNEACTRLNRRLL